MMIERLRETGYSLDQYRTTTTARSSGALGSALPRSHNKAFELRSLVVTLVRGSKIPESAPLCLSELLSERLSTPI
jgi:hypothetical protein